MNYSELFNKLDVRGQGYLCMEQIKEFCERCFFCTLDPQRVEEAITRVCGHRHCAIERLRDVIGEVVKLIKAEKNIRWEFKFLDKRGSGRISLSDALFLFKSVQGSGFTLGSWQLFLSQRPNITCSYVTCDELVEALLSGGSYAAIGDSNKVATTSFDDYMANKLELSRMVLERKQTIYTELQKLVEEISSTDNDDFLEDVLDDNGVTATTMPSSKMSLVDKATARLEDIKRNGLNAFTFSPPKDSLCEDDEISSTDAVTATCTVKEQNEEDDINIAPELSDLDKRNLLESIINKLVLAIYKCLAEKLLADLVVCNHADVPRPESLQNDYSQLLSQLPSDMRQTEEFSLGNKWTNALEKLFSQCDVHIYCLAVIETNCDLLEIFDNKMESKEKFAKLMNWLAKSCRQELIAVERSLAQNCDLATVHKMVLQLCYTNNALQQEADFTSALLITRVLQLSFKEQIFISQHKESATLSLLHLLLASTRISRSSAGNVTTAVSLCPVHDVLLPERMTVYLQNMALEIITRRHHLKCMDFIRVLKSRNLNCLLRNYNQNSLSIDSALLKYKELKESNCESRKKSNNCYNNDITGDDTLMEGLAIRCHLLITHAKRNTGIGCLVDAMTKMLASLQKLQVYKAFAVLDKFCQEDIDDYREVAETTQQNFDSFVFPTEDSLIAQFYDTSVYTEVVMGIKALYMCLLRCLFLHTFETGSLKINLLSSLSKHMLIFFVMQKFSCIKTSNISSLDAVLPGLVRGNLIVRYFELLKHFCSERVVTLEGSQALVHSKHKEFTTMQELIDDFYAVQKEKPIHLQPSEAYHSIYQCMELEISLFRSAEKFKGHVTMSSEYGAAMVVALFHTQYQEIYNETDPNNLLCLLAQGLHLRHFDGSDYKCEAPLLQCFLGYNLFTKPMEVTRNSTGLDNEFEPLAFSSHARVSKCKSLLDTMREQSFLSINLLRSILLHIKCDQSCVADGDVAMELNRIFFLVTELYYQKKLTSQIKELIGDQIYYQCLLAKQNYSISACDENWVVLVWLIMLLDQKQWNLYAYVASKAIKEVDNITKTLGKLYCQMDSLLLVLCQIPASKYVTFQYLDIMKSHLVSALHSKYNTVLSKLLPLCIQSGDQESLLIWTEWLGKFWFMLRCGEHGKMVDAGDHSKVVTLTYPWHQHFTNMEGKKESDELSCTVAEVTSALGEMYTLELEGVLEQAKFTDQNKMAFFRYKIARIYWEQINLKNMSNFETSLILLNVLKSLASTNSTCNYKDQLLKLAQLKSHGRNLAAEDVTIATNHMSSLVMYVEKSVRTAKKSAMSFDNFATFGDFFLQIPGVIIKEMMKKHKLEEEVFFSLCGTICWADVTAELSCEDDTVEKLRTDRQQWRLSADVIGAETQGSTSTITGVLILDEHHIKKREAHIKLLQKAMLINLRDAWKQCTALDHPRFLENKIVNMFARLLQIQLDEANGTIGKLSRVSVKSQRGLYSEYRMSLVQCWLDNIAAVLLGIDPAQNRLMSKAMRVNLQQRHNKLQRRKDSSIKARRSVQRVKRQASLSPYASEDDHGSTSSFLSALEEDTQQELNQSMPELSFQAQLKRMAEIEKEFQSEKMKILLQLEEQQNKMEVKSPSKSRKASLLTTSNVTEGSHQHLRARAKSAGALKMKERMKERKRKKLSRMETQLDYSSADDTQEETLNQTSADDTATILTQLEELYEEKKKILLSSMQ